MARPDEQNRQENRRPRRLDYVVTAEMSSANIPQKCWVYTGFCFHKCAYNLVPVGVVFGAGRAGVSQFDSSLTGAAIAMMVACRERLLTILGAPAILMRANLAISM